MAIDRRRFLAGLGGFAVGVGAGGFSHWLPFESPRTGPDWAPGIERLVSSTCMLCPARCGIRGRLMDGKLVGIRGNPKHPVSAGGLCAKGVAGLQLLYHPGRLNGPVERTGAPGSTEFKPVTWDYALERVGSRLKELREKGQASSVMMIAGHVPGLMGELLDQFTTAYGTPHLIREDYSDASSEVLRRFQGIDAQPSFDLSSADFVLSFGVPLAEAWAGLPQAAAVRNAPPGRQPRWVQIDARYSRTAAQADEWVAVRHGTFGLFALGLAHVILKEGLYDAESVRADVRGLEDEKGANGEQIPGFRSLAAKYGRTAEVADRTGVDPESIVRLAKSFGMAKRPIALWDNVVTWRADGLSDAMAIHALNILVGAPARPGGVFVQPELPVPRLAAMAGSKVSDKPPQPSRLTRANWASLVGRESVPAPEVVFSYYSNPVASLPNRAEVTEVLDRAPLVVSFSPFLDETARHANLVLPDCTYLERWQDAPAPPSVPIPVWGIVQPMVEPIHDTRATGDVLLDLARRVGGDLAETLPFASFEEIVKTQGVSLARASRGGVFADELSREEMRELEARGWWVAHGQSESEFWDSMVENGGWFDPFYDYHDRSMFSRFDDGKARLSALDESRVATMVGREAAAIAAASQHDDAMKKYPLQMIPFRVMTMASGGTALTPWLLEDLGLLTGDAWRTWIEINPATASEQRVTNGELVTVESEAGRFQARVRLFAGAQPGVLNVPYGLHSNVEGWGRVEGANPLLAVGNRIDAETGMPDWYSARVRLVRT